MPSQIASLWQTFRQMSESNGVQQEQAEAPGGAAADEADDISLEDAAEFPSIETTGTTLFVYGLAWGVNNGLLGAPHRAAAAAGWSCLSRPTPAGAVAPDGRLGWCQPGGGSPQQNFGFNSTSDYCVGTFLLAGAELAKMVHVQ